MTDGSLPCVDADAATTLMRWADLPLEGGRAADLAARLERFRTGLRTLDRFVGRDVEPIGLHLPREE